jgi:putative hydrolase of the HAD superfamily
MSGTEAVLFDLYDTLVTGNWSQHTALVARHLGVPAPVVNEAYDLLREQRDSGHHADVHSVLEALAEACGVAPLPRLIDELAEAEARHLAHKVDWYADSVPVLRELRATGYKLAVVSNCSPSTRPVVERLRLEEETDVVVLSCEVGVSKPAPGIFRAALDRLEVEPHGAVFVDDRGDYLDGAGNLGMGTFRIARDVAFGEDRGGSDPPLSADLAGLPSLLRGNRG